MVGDGELIREAQHRIMRDVGTWPSAVLRRHECGWNVAQAVRRRGAEGGSGRHCGRVGLARGKGQHGGGSQQQATQVGVGADVTKNAVETVHSGMPLPEGHRMPQERANYGT